MVFDFLLTIYSQIKSRMKIIFKRTTNQCKDFFPTVQDFVNYLKENYNKINFDNPLMIEEIKKVYSLLIDVTLEETVRYNRFTRRLFSLFKFKSRNCKQNLFWKERGWNEEETKKFLNTDLSTIIKKGCKTRRERDKNKHDFIENGVNQLFKYKGAKFSSILHPKCNCCQCNLVLNKIYVKNNLENFFYIIKKCSNENCQTHKMHGFDLYRVFLPIECAESHINVLSNRIKKSNRLCVEKWMSEGLSEIEAKEKISKTVTEIYLLPQEEKIPILCRSPQMLSVFSLLIYEIVHPMRDIKGSNCMISIKTKSKKSVDIIFTCMPPGASLFVETLVEEKIQPILDMHKAKINCEFNSISSTITIFLERA